MQDYLIVKGQIDPIETENPLEVLGTRPSVRKCNQHPCDEESV